jgi:hypothetical protein
LPALYRIRETERFQLFSSLVWAFYAAKIESSEIQEEEPEGIPEEIIDAQEVYRANFNLPHLRFVAARQINNEARKILHAIQRETAGLLPPQESQRWLAKTEQNNRLMTTSFAPAKRFSKATSAKKTRISSKR